MSSEETHNPEVDGYHTVWVVSNCDDLTLKTYHQALQQLIEGGAQVTAYTPPSFHLTLNGLIEFATENKVCGTSSAGSLWRILTRAAFVQQAGIKFAKVIEIGSESPQNPAIDGDSIVSARASSELYKIRGLKDRQSTSRLLLNRIIAHNSPENTL